jgi:hypothetical protein
MTFSISSIKKEVQNKIALGQIDSGLRAISNFVEKIITEPICAGQVFSSQDLDELCMLMGRKSLAASAKLLVDLWPERKRVPTVVYLVSRLQRSGGHSRLVQDFIRAQPEKNHLILSTELCGSSDKDFNFRYFSSLDNVRFVRAPRKSFEKRLEWLQSSLLALQPDHVFIFNHHQDSVAVAALVPELGFKGSFIHHGDHHLCLGVHMDHLDHVDLHPMGYHYCRDELGVDNHYLPLTFEDKQCVPIQTDFMDYGSLTTATVAGSNKIEVPYYISYVELIPQVLKVTGGKHIHIGKLTPWTRWRIYSQLRKHRIPKDRFIYINWVPSVWEALQEHNVDLYLASFPYGAGLSLIEAMGAGIPVILHRHMYSRVNSSLELAYSEANCWSDSSELLTYLSSLRPEKLVRERQLARQQYERFHRPEILQNYLSSGDPIKISVPPLAKSFKPRWDEWAGWAESRVSVSHLIYRFAYRTFRTIRARFQLFS